MDSINSCADYSALIRILNDTYGMRLTDITLHREMIGHVYFAGDGTRRYVLKLYRSFNRDQAVQSAEIIRYLMTNGYPVVPIVATSQGSPHFEVSTPDGQRVGILFEYIEGSEPDLRTELSSVGRQVGELHRLMERYPNPLITRGKKFYVDRFVADLRQLSYAPDRVSELEQLGQELWQGMERLPMAFCHGDLHSANMRQTGERKYVLFDFDIASRAYSIIDIATLTNASDFNRFDEAAYDATMARLEEFNRGYSQIGNISDLEVEALLDFIPIRHYELISTISEAKGLNALSKAFLDQQYEWLMNWRVLCERKRQR